MSIYKRELDTKWVGYHSDLLTYLLTYFLLTDIIKMTLKYCQTLCFLFTNSGVQRQIVSNQEKPGTPSRLYNQSLRMSSNQDSRSSSALDG